MLGGTVCLRDIGRGRSYAFDGKIPISKLLTATNGEVRKAQFTGAQSRRS
jgi:hypothetical protein